MAAIGIDLGTSTSCVAIWRQGRVDVITNEEGQRTTPSYVAFTETERLIGESARNQAALNPLNTVYGVKRLIGRRYDDAGFQMDLRHWAFRILNDNGNPIVLVNYKGEQTRFAPEEISGMILNRLKEVAEAYLNTRVEHAVITVPAYFNDAQRQATRAAGTIAGLKILRITNEPSAAALAYGLDRAIVSKHVLIYDLGGGTFDATVINIGNSIYQVKSTAGNTRLGGEDIDNRMVAYFAEDFRKRFHIDVTGNARSLRRLKSAAENVKKLLTSATEAKVNVESLFNGIDYSGQMSRALFDELCSDLLTDTLGPVQKVLKESRLQKTDIKQVVLIGGSTRIPKVHEILREFFKGVPITSSVNPDEAVACGAAIQAAYLSGQRHQTIKDLQLIDVVPLSLGVETVRGAMFKVIERNMAIPCRNTKELTTLEDNQCSMTIEVFEGERSLTKDNNLLGVFELKGIPPAPRGIAKVDVTFSIDFNGILSVTACDRATGNTESLTINNEHRLKDRDIGMMLARTKAFQLEDREHKRRLEAQNQLETFIFEVKHTVTLKGNFITPKEKSYMLEQFEKATEWLEKNGNSLQEEFEWKHTELMQKWSGILMQIHNPSIHLV